MPARFLEVANPLEAARKSGSLTYVTSQISWERFNLSSLSSLFVPSNQTNSTLSRVAGVAANVHRPSGLAQACLIIGGVIYVLQTVLLHWMAKRQVAAHGHAHRD